jgi:hypothetical protein
LLTVLRLKPSSRNPPDVNARDNSANMRSIFDFSAENAKIADCLAERGGFEPPVPLAFIWAAFGPSLAHYSAPNESIGVGENLFARSSALLRSPD